MLPFCLIKVIVVNVNIKQDQNTLLNNNFIRLDIFFKIPTLLISSANLLTNKEKKRSTNYYFSFY